MGTIVDTLLADMRRKYLHTCQRELLPNGEWLKGDPITAKILESWIPQIEQAAAHIERLEADAQSKQARIDALMLEHCPDEMTAEQREEWARHQVPSHPPVPVRGEPMACPCGKCYPDGYFGER